MHCKKPGKCFTHYYDVRDIFIIVRILSNWVVYLETLQEYRELCAFIKGLFPLVEVSIGTNFTWHLEKQAGVTDTWNFRILRRLSHKNLAVLYESSKIANQTIKNFGQFWFIKPFTWELTLTMINNNFEILTKSRKCDRL